MTPDEFAALSDDEKFQILDDESDPRYEAVLDYLSPESEVNAPSEEAPFGWMNDPLTGERRPKKRPGRVRKVASTAPAESSDAVTDVSPEISEQRAPIDRVPDRSPSAGRRKGRGGRRGSRSGDVPRVEVPRGTVDAPPFRAGTIAKGMNKLYRRVGKLVKMADPMIGQAFIDITVKDDEDDTTVGEAWEELAKVNPRIRAALLKLMTGSGWGTLLACHLPVLMAVGIRTGFLERLPLGGLMQAFGPDEDDSPAQVSDNPFAGLTEEDMAQAAAFAAQTAAFAAQMGVVSPPFSRGA
jgi:hypothetical protein